MPYNESLAESIRLELQKMAVPFTEKKMFGGLSFMYKDKMSIGVMKDKITVRVKSEFINTELEKPHCTVMNFTGKPMKEFLFVDADIASNRDALLHYIELGLAHAEAASKK